MAKKNWFETINDRVPAETKFEVSLPSFGKGFFNSLIGEDPFGFDAHITPIKDLMEELDGVFQDKGDHYEMVTNLGGFHVPAGVPENAVKVQLTGKKENIVEISYEHSSDDGDEFYSHSQKTSVMLPADVIKETLKAYFDDDDNVVISVEKKKPNEENGKAGRIIPITGKDK